MKKWFLLAAFLWVGICSYAQITLEEGYFITPTNDTVWCSIKNVDWKNTPTEFKYQLPGETTLQTAKIDEVLGFGIGEDVRYIKATVAIDRSSKDNSKLSEERRPVFHNETLFLQVLVAGKASLYVYHDKLLVRYFYQKEGEAITQLVHKFYVIEKSKIRENSNFRNQLWNNLQCGNVTRQQLERLEYRQKELTQYVEAYNQCVSGETGVVLNTSKTARDAWHLSIRPGINFSSLTMETTEDFMRKTTEFDNQVTFRIGAELTYALPFNKNKWDLFVEPTFQYFQSQGKDQDGNEARIDYQSVEVPLGLRYNMFLNHQNKVFVNMAYVFDFSKRNNISSAYDYNLEVNTRNNVALGVGATLNKKYTLELRWLPRRDLLNNFVPVRTKYRTFSIIVGYTLL